MLHYISQNKSDPLLEKNVEKYPITVNVYLYIQQK